MVSILRILLAFLLSTCSIFGERYVPVVTSNDLEEALSSVLPGDRIHLLNTEPLIADTTFIGIANGTLEEPITIEGQGLEYAYLRSAYSTYLALEILGNNWILRNFALSDSEVGLYLTGNNNLVEYVIFNIRRLGLGMHGNKNNTIRKCVFRNVTWAGIDITGSGNNIISNEFVALGQSSVAISVYGSINSCCGYIAGNRFYTRGSGSWDYFVINSGYFYQYYNNYGNYVRYHGFYILNSQSNEFRGNHCDRLELMFYYCIFQANNAYTTFVYSDNTCNECLRLTNVPVIDT